MPPVRILAPCPVQPTSRPRPSLVMRPACGFPSPAEDFLQEALDLNELVIHNTVATFFAQAEGDSMVGFDIHHGDLLVVDRSIEAKDGDIALVLWDGGLTVKKLRIRRRTIELHSGHPSHPPIIVADGVELQVWGVITWSFRKHYRKQ
jgi:DNA polymerase V